MSNAAHQRKREGEKKRERSDEIFVWRLRPSLSRSRSTRWCIQSQSDCWPTQPNSRLKMLPWWMEKVLSDQRTINKIHRLKTEWRSFLPLALFLPSLSIILFSWNSCRNNLIYNWLPNANFTTGETGEETEEMNSSTRGRGRERTWNAQDTNEREREEEEQEKRVRLFYLLFLFVAW